MTNVNTMTRRRFALALTATPLALGVTQESVKAAARQPQAPDSSETHRPVADFPLHQVTLGEGPFRDAQTWNRAFMLRISCDRLLHTFRHNAGLPSSQPPLGGWEAPDCELRGHFTGHYLSACALAYAGQGDAELKTRGDYLVKALAECQAALDQGGYLSAFPQELFVRLDARQGVWAPFYTYHKIMAGLLDMHIHAGNAEALRVVTAMAGWVDAWTAARTPAHMQEILKDEFGGMAEVLYEIASVTGDKHWLATADRFNKQSFLAPLLARSDELEGLHANTHIPQVNAALRRYELTSDASYREIANFFWDTVTSTRTYATGGSGNREFWRTRPNHLADEWQQGHDHQECCCCYNMLKLTRRLHAHAPQVRYMDYYERNLLNHRLGTIEPESGRTGYFLSLAPGAWKTLATDDTTFWCCTGTAIEDFSKLGDTIYHNDGHGLHVNLFIASTLDWTERGIRLHQQTQFPRSGQVTLTVEAAPGGEWPIHIRIPAWTSKTAQVTLNDRPLAGTVAPGTYLTISRTWQPGDRITLDLPMPLHVESFPDVPHIQALMAGPLVLAAQMPRGEIPLELAQDKGPAVDKLPTDAITLKSNGTPLDESVKPFGDNAHHYVATASDGSDVIFKPLNTSWDRFSVYLDMSA